jgi:uroporphyrin-III C-methyltransferase
MVYLVGAGPGDPDLITVRGLRCLREADVVVYDALVAPELLEESRPDAERVYGGKRGYCVGSNRQEDINTFLVELARAGKVVCRLKGGDPCVFGRGGEEAEHLAAAGVPFEIIPGVTAALGACAAAGIPLTHRAVGPTVTLVSGHHEPGSPGCTLDWEALARLGNLVFYMALRHVEKIVGRLIAAGLAGNTPAAVIAAGASHIPQVVEGELDTIARLTADADVQPPALLVVGQSVRFRARLLAVARETEAALSRS